MKSPSATAPHELNSEIKELKSYLASQTASVTLVIDEWNDQLRTLSLQVGEAHQEREDLLRDNLKVRMETNLIMQVIVDLELRRKDHEHRLERAAQLYAKTVAQYKAHIQELRQEHTNLLSSVS